MCDWKLFFYNLAPLYFTSVLHIPLHGIFEGLEVGLEDRNYGVLFWVFWYLRIWIYHLLKHNLRTCIIFCHLSQGTPCIKRSAEMHVSCE